MLSRRNFTGSTTAWETLITLVHFRKHGAEFAQPDVLGEFSAYVDIEWTPDEDEEAIP